MKCVLQKEKAYLIDEGFIEVTKHPAVSVISGEEIKAGVLFIRIKGDTSEAITLDECTDQNYLGLDTQICCYCV